MVLMTGSVAVQLAASQHHMHIDLVSMQALELIQPLKVGSASNKKGSTSLFRWV